jgi:hypothetical protein
MRFFEYIEDKCRQTAINTEWAVGYIYYAWVRTDLAYSFMSIWISVKNLSTEGNYPRNT